MNRKDAALIVVAATASVLAAALYVENRRLHEIIAREDLDGRAGSVSESAATPPVTVADAPDEPAEPVRSDGPPPAAAEADTPPRPRSERFERFAENMSRMLTDPDSRDAILTRMKSRVDRVYGDLFVALGLDEVQAETLRTLLAERQMARMEAGMLLRTAESEEEREQARLWREEKLASLDAGLEAVLGPEAGQILEEYQRTAPIRNVVEDVSRRASYVGAPMSAEQSARLVSVMQSVDETLPLPGAGDAAAGDLRRGPDTAQLTPEYVQSYLDSLRKQNQAVLERAREFLSPEQLEALADQQVENFEATEKQLNFALRNPDVTRMPFFGGPGGRGVRGRGPGPGGP